MMNMEVRSFNLIHEPWIPTVTARGKAEDLGLLTLFERAKELSDVSDSSPIIRVAIYRLLLAILYRTQKIEKSTDWATLWRDWWNADAIRAYLEKWESHFDLFSGSVPFFQRADLDTGGKLTPLTKLSPEFTAGNNKQLPDHSCDDDPPAFSPARAARLLLAAQAWSIGGGVSGGGRPNFTSASLPKGICLLALGSDLSETLLLNLAPLQRLRLTPRHLYREGLDDRPAWERIRNEMVASRHPDGPADCFTWQARYIRLRHDDDGQVRFAAYAQGEKFDPISVPFIDPFHAYGDSKTAGKLPRALSPDRAVWRDAGSLFGAMDAENGATSATIHHLADARANGAELPRVLPVLTAGVAVPGGQPPPDAWCTELFRVPVEMFTSESNALGLLHSALASARDAADALRRALYMYANTFMKMESGGADPKDVAKLADGMRREPDYWAALETPFHELLPTLGDDEPAVPKWNQAVRSAVVAAFEASLLSQDSTGRHLRALNEARATFYSKSKGIGSLFPIQEAVSDGIEE